MESINDKNLLSYLRPSKILENSEYIDWLYSFSLKHKQFSNDASYLYNNIDKEDIDNLSKLTIFMSALDYICMTQNVRRYSAFLHESNTTLVSIYFMYKNKRFVITKETSSLVSCKVSTRPKTDKHKHKYVILDKLFKK